MGEQARRHEDRFEGPAPSFDIWDFRKMEAGKFTMHPDTVKAGLQALQLEVSSGDKAAGGTERSEIEEQKQLGPYENKECGYTFSIFLPEDFPIVSTRLVLAQWKQYDTDNQGTINNPILALRYRDGELFLTSQTSPGRVELFRITEDVRGKWLDFRFKMVFSRDSEKGFIKVFLNDKQLVDYTGANAYSEEQNYVPNGRFYFKMGLYRDSKGDAPMKMIVDNFQRTDPLDE